MSSEEVGSPAPRRLNPGTGLRVTTLSFDDFQRARRFRSLDGLRAIAILMVVTVHSTSHGNFRPWAILDGSMGVPIFFVLSGFLITTLLLREYDSTGTVSLKAFYVRRVMRLAPLYYLALVAYLLIVLLSSDPDALARRNDMLKNLPLFLVYLNEYTRGVYPVFGQTWSLGIEEKFYLVWPALGFVCLSSGRTRAIAASGLLGGFWAIHVLGADEHVWYSLSYGALFVGSLLALALNNRQMYGQLARCGTLKAQTVVFLAVVTLQLHPWAFQLRRSPVYAILTALLVLTSIVAQDSLCQRALRSRMLVYIGKRSYAVYLVHVLAMHVAERIPGLADETTTAALGAYFTTVALSLTAAELLYRFVERPCIEIGHRLSLMIQRRMTKQLQLRSLR